MRKRSVLAAVLIAVASLALPVVTAIPAHAQGCPAYWVIGARGSSDRMTGPFTMGPTVGAYAEQAATALPAATTEYLSLPYAAAPVGPNYFDSVNAGWQGLQAIIRTRIAQCPQIRIGLIGYSQGAHVINDAMHALEGSDPAALEHVRAILLIADPRSDPAARYHLPVALSGRPVTDRQHGGVLGSQSLPAAVHGRAVDLCISGDPVCDALDGSLLLAQGMSFPIHTSAYRVCCSDFPLVRILGAGMANRLLAPTSESGSLRPSSAVIREPSKT